MSAILRWLDNTCYDLWKRYGRWFVVGAIYVMYFTLLGVVALIVFVGERV